jgi:hypothetical protein
MTYLETGCRAALAFVFFIACVSKVQGAGSFREFRDSLKDLGLPSARVVRTLSLAIPAIEGLTVILLAVSRTSLWGLIAATAVLGAFTAGISIAKAQGKVVRCRCFGGSGALASSAHIARNLVLLTAAVAGALAGISPGSGHDPGLVIFAVGLGIIAAGLFLRWDELSFLLKPAHSPGAGG